MIDTNADPNPSWFGRKCFEINSRGRGWCVMLDNHPAWFGRGPSGYLLGPFRTSAACGGKILQDIRKCDRNDTVEWTVNALNREADMRAYAMLEEQVTTEPGFPTYRISSEGTDDLFVVAGPEGVIEELLEFDLIAASNAASAARIAFSAGE